MAMEPYWANVQSDYEGSNDGDLSIYVGDLLYITETNEQGWALANVVSSTSSKRTTPIVADSLVGWVPAEYTVKTNPPPQSQSSSTSQDDKKIHPEGTSSPDTTTTTTATTTTPSPTTAPSDTAPLCPVCSKRVSIAYVVYQGKKHHPECFKCQHCE